VQHDSVRRHFHRRPSLKVVLLGVALTGLDCSGLTGLDCSGSTAVDLA